MEETICNTIIHIMLCMWFIDDQRLHQRNSQSGRGKTCPIFSLKKQVYRFTPWHYACMYTYLSWSVFSCFSWDAIAQMGSILERSWLQERSNLVTSTFTQQHNNSPRGKGWGNGTYWVWLFLSRQVVLETILTFLSGSTHRVDRSDCIN